ncbi:hypothetical protein [Clostridium oryzae]|uniref:Fibronectin type III domain protein n=1 Tax=Clostridium oryzae TaxID=1450648 RepID=A0A1V4IS18_9CLOT|nr:hypothetical protein [Clostridium oryzae]OPJ62605.1 fibronectin type III domain protein [Clostridium oryzae]
MKLRKSIAMFMCLLFLCTFKVDTFAKTKLAAPKGVTVTADSQRVLSVYWNSVKGASSYCVYYSHSLHGKYHKGIKLSSTGRSLSGVKKGEKWYVKVKAFKGGTSSAFSKVVSIVIKSCPSAPKKLKATYSKSTGKVTIKWKKVSKASSYYVYCSSNKSLGYKIISDSKGMPMKFKKTSAVLKAQNFRMYEGETWHFRVTAVKDKMESKKSSSTSVKIEKDKAKCFPKLSNVPVIPNKKYTTKYSEDGTTVYYQYKVSDLTGNTVSNYDSLLQDNGWSYVDKQESDGFKIYIYSNGSKKIYIAYDDTYFIIYGSLWQ